MVGNTSLLVSPYQDTCGVSETCDFSEKEESTMRNNYSIHFQASCPYHYKGLQPRFLLWLCLRVWWSWCAGLGATVKVPRICTIPAQHQESAPALQRRSPVTGPHKSLPQRRALVHTFTVYRGLGIGSLVIFAINTQYYLSILWCTSSFSFILHVQTSHLQLNAATKDCGVQPAYKCST